MAYIGKKETYAKIIEVISGEKIPVKLRQSNVSSLRYEGKKNQNNVITKVIPECITMTANTDLNKRTIFQFLTKEQQAIAIKVSEQLFTICHEIGHMMTLPGHNYSEIEAEYSLHHNTPMFMDQKQKHYRTIKAEAMADQWACDWIESHLELALALDQQIIKMCKFQNALK